jgi:HEAT repeat protein
MLGELRDRAAVPDLIRVLATVGEDTAVLIDVVAALVAIGDPAALPVLRQVAAWPEPLTLHGEYVKDAAAEGVITLEERKD